MKELVGATNDLDGVELARQLNLNGYAMLPGFVRPDDLESLIGYGGKGAAYTDQAAALFPELERMPHRARMPGTLISQCMALYPRLANIANDWSQRLAGGGVPFGEAQACHFEAGAPRVEIHADIGVLDSGAQVALHHAHADRLWFPLQVVALLSSPGSDYSGGELVLVEQRPRMQSRATVIPLQLGDAAIIAASERPVKGRAGPYRVKLRHGVSRVHNGTRIGLELFFRERKKSEQGHS